MGTSLLLLHVVEDIVNELEVCLVDLAEVLLDIDVRNLVLWQLMVQHVMDGHLVNVRLVESNSRHRVSCGIESETDFIDFLPDLLHSTVQVVAEVRRILVHPVKAEHIPLLLVQHTCVLLDKRHEQRMRLDDDAGMVRPSVLCLGTVIGDVTLTVPLAGEDVNAVGTHHHEGYKKYVTRDVAARIRAILVRDGSQCPQMFE